MRAPGRFLRHSWCPHCGSRDAYTLYSDNHAFCFSCHAYDTQAYGGDGTGGYKRMAKELIDPGEAKALAARKLTKATCEFYGYTVSDNGGRACQVAPYYRNGTLTAQHLRFADKGFSWKGKAKKLEMFGQRNFPAGSHRRLVITEGEIDAMSVAQTFGLKQPVVSIPSGTGSAEQSILDNLEWISSFDEVVLAFDNDEPGVEARDKVKDLFRPGTLRFFLYPEGIKDANELLQQGKAQLISEGVLKAERYSPSGIIEGTDLFQLLMEEDKPGLMTQYPVLNEKLHGLRTGELYLFCAGSGIGKTTLVKEISHHFLTTHQQTLGVIALEESKKRTVQSYVGIELNKPLHIDRTGVTLEALEGAFKRTVGSGRFWLYDHWGSLESNSLLSRLRYLAVGCKVNWIVLDHISIVVSGMEGDNERKDIDILMTNLRSLIEETGVGVLAIVHLKRPHQGIGYNEGRIPVLTDLRGSGGLEQISDVVVALSGNQYGQNPDERVVHILKNRPIGKLGACDTLYYNHMTGRLSDGPGMFNDESGVKDDAPF